MAEEEKTQEKVEAGKGGGMKSLVLNILVAGSAVAAGFATPYLLAGGNASQSGKGQAERKEIPEEDLELAYHEFGDVTSNLDEKNLTRYLRIKLSLEFAKEDKEKIVKLVEDKEMILRDWLNRYIASQTMESIRGMSGQNRLRREIKDYFNSTLFLDGVERIRSVLFLEFNIQ